MRECRAGGEMGGEGNEVTARQMGMSGSGMKRQKSDSIWWAGKE